MIGPTLSVRFSLFGVHKCLYNVCVLLCVLGHQYDIILIYRFYVRCDVSSSRACASASTSASTSRIGLVLRGNFHDASGDIRIVWRYDCGKKTVILRFWGFLERHVQYGTAEQSSEELLK